MIFTKLFTIVPTNGKRDSSGATVKLKLPTPYKKLRVFKGIFQIWQSLTEIKCTWRTLIFWAAKDNFPSEPLNTLNRCLSNASRVATSEHLPASLKRPRAASSRVPSFCEYKPPETWNNYAHKKVEWETRTRITQIQFHILEKCFPRSIAYLLKSNDNNNITWPTHSRIISGFRSIAFMIEGKRIRSKSLIWIWLSKFLHSDTIDKSGRVRLLIMILTNTSRNCSCGNWFETHLTFFLTKSIATTFHTSSQMPKILIAPIKRLQ